MLAFIPLTHSVFWGALAYVLIGGVGVGTLLTLLFLPALYALWFRVARAPRAAGAHARRGRLRPVLTDPVRRSCPSRGSEDRAFGSERAVRSTGLRSAPSRRPARLPDPGVLAAERPRSRPSLDDSSHLYRSSERPKDRGMPRVSQEQAKLNRQRVVEVAAALFRERGLHGVGVADIMASAGLTHGGFYGQFANKDALAAEAFDAALSARTGAETWTPSSRTTCPSGTSGRPGRAARSRPWRTTSRGSRPGSPVRARFTHGVEGLAGHPRRPDAQGIEGAPQAAVPGDAVDPRRRRRAGAGRRRRGAGRRTAPGGALAHCGLRRSETALSGAGLSVSARTASRPVRRSKRCIS